MPWNIGGGSRQSSLVALEELSAGRRCGKRRIGVGYQRRGVLQEGRRGKSWRTNSGFQRRRHSGEQLDRGEWRDVLDDLVQSARQERWGRRVRRVERG